jgi:hypothetical protein
MALWTLWCWRRQLGQHHLAIPLLGLLVAAAGCVAMGSSDRALMLGVPGVAVLAAFALPTLQRASTAAIDWLSVFFFTLSALIIWIFYGAIQTGVPAAAQAAVQRLAPGFEPVLSLPALGLGLIATLAWIALVRWRTTRHRPVIWKSLVLPAGGVALCWLLLMTLGLPLLDYARSNRTLATRLLQHLSGAVCIAAPDASNSLVAALEFHGKRSVNAGANATDCPVLVKLLIERGPAAGASAAAYEALRKQGWHEVARVRGPTERSEVVVVYRRTPGSPNPVVLSR